MLSPSHAVSAPMSAPPCATSARPSPRLRRRLSFLLTAVSLLGLAATPRAQTLPETAAQQGKTQLALTPTLFYVMNAVGDGADGGAVGTSGTSALGQFNDSDVISFRPGFGESAVKIHGPAEFNALVGDPEFDDDFGKIHGGDIDALGIRRPGHTDDRLRTDRLVFSVEHAWGSSYPVLQQEYVGTLDGTLFSLDRWPDGTLRVEFFLHEAQLTAALGQPPAGPGVNTPMVDIDAFVQDHAGNVYLSFRHDEMVLGTLLADDGVICLPRTEMAFDSDGNIGWISPNSALIVLDKPRVDGLVQAAQLSTKSGNSIGSLIDLQALALDPLGGSFTPVQAVPGLPDGVPHLLFNGQALGATVLTTRTGGTIASWNGHALGSSIANGAGLGLDPSTSGGSASDLNGLLVASSDRPQLLVDVEQLTIDHDEDLVFVLGNFAPNGWAWVKVAATSPASGGNLVASPSETASPYPWLLVPEPSVQWAVPLDDAGRALITVPMTYAPNDDLWVVLQAYEVGSGELSAPASIWAPWP